MEILTDDIRAMGERLTRRGFLGRSGAGLGSVALGLLLEAKRLWSAESSAEGQGPMVAEKWGGVLHPLHFPPPVKRIIHLSPARGPSPLELFHHKPNLTAPPAPPTPHPP